MQTAIDQYNKQLENDEDASNDGEENVKKIAHMFKLINMQKEGMNFYSNFILFGKHNVVSGT